MSSEVSREFEFLFCLEIVAVPAHPGKQTAILAGY